MPQKEVTPMALPYKELLEKAFALWPRHQSVAPPTYRETAMLRVVCSLIDEQTFAIRAEMLDRMYPNVAPTESETFKLDDVVRKSLEVIRQVLDYETDSSQARNNIMVWVKNAVNDLLAGREVELPPRCKDARNPPG
jgi:hypothetical protein